MSVATQLEMIATFDQWAQGNQEIADLLQLAVRYVQLRIATDSLRLYHQNERYVWLGAEIGEKSGVGLIQLESDPQWSQIIQHTEPIYEIGRWLVPLACDNASFRWLEVSVTSDEHPDIREWLMLIGALLAQALDIRTLRTLSHQLGQISSELTRSTTFRQIAAILAKYLLRRGQFISINLFTYDETNTVNGFKVIATANRKAAFDTDQSLTGFTVEQMGMLASEIYYARRFTLVSDVNSETSISSYVIQWLQNVGVMGICSFPLISRDDVLGFISINSTADPLFLAQTEMEAYQSISDQVAGLIQLGQVSEQSDYRQAISERQKRAINELVAGQNFDEMAGIIAQHMLPQKGRFLAINEILYDAQGEMSGWRVLASANRLASYRWNENFVVPLNELKREFWLKIKEGEAFFLENITPNVEEIAGLELAQWLIENGIKAYYCIPITLNERTVAVLVILNREEIAFGRDETNAFISIAEQMGTLIQVRQLLEQTRSSRQLIDNLLLANRLVVAASDASAVAQAIIYTLARQLKVVTIHLFEPPVAFGDVPTTQQIIGASDANDVIMIETSVRYPAPFSGEQISRLFSNLPLITDVDQQPEALQVWWNAQGLQWGALFGIRSDERVIGTLNLLHSQAYPLSNEEMEAFSTVADQIGVSLRGRQLFTESETAYAIASQLVDVNLAVSTADDYDEMMRAIIANLPEAIELAALMLFNEPSTLQEPPQSIRIVTLATRDEVAHPDVIDTLDPEMLEKTGVFKTFVDNELLVIDDIRQYRRLLMPNYVSTLLARGMNSYIGIGLRVGARVLGVVAFATSKLSALTDLQRDHLRAIASQIAVAVENRFLINQTTDTLNSVALQYETSNAVYRASGPAEMLSALTRLTNPSYQRAEIGIIDSEAPDYVRIVAQLDVDGSLVEANSTTGTIISYPVPPDLQPTRDVLQSPDKFSLSLPLLSSKRTLIGLVTLKADHPVEIAPNNLRALRTLSDQMAITLENRYLLEQAEQSFEEILRLYDVNNALVGASDPLEVLRLIHDLIANDAYQITLNALEYDLITEQLTTFVIDSVIDAEGKTVRLQTPLHPSLGTELLSAIGGDLQKNAQEILFLEQINDRRYVQLFQLYDAAGPKIVSAVLIPIMEYDQVKQQIMVLFTKPRAFNLSQRRLYSALRDQLTIVLQNQRLLRDTRNSAAQLGNQVRILQTLNQLTLSMINTRDERILIDDAAQALVTALRIDHVGVAMINPDGKTSTVVSEYPLTDDRMVGFKIEGEDEIQSLLRQTKQPVLLRDIPTDSRISAGTKAMMSALNIYSMLILPMIDAQNQLIGSVGLDILNPERQITNEMVDTARAITAQLIISLQNLRQLQAAQRQAAQLQRLATIGQTLQTQFDVESMLITVVQETPKIITADQVAVILLPIEQRTPQLAMTYTQGELNTVSRPIDLTGSAAERITQGESFVYLPVMSDQTAVKHLFDREMESVLALPIFTRGMAIGILEVSALKPFAYSETDQLIFRQLVSQLGGALENAEAYTQSQRVARSKALVNEITTQLQRQIDLDGILNVTMGELGRALGAKRGRIRLGTQTSLPPKTE